MVASVQPTVHQQKIAAAHRRRLEELELKQATLGLETPPHIANEIEDIRAQLAGVVDVQPISDEDRYQSSMRAIMLLSQQLAAVEVKVERLYWLLPAILFGYLILSFILEHL